MVTVLTELENGIGLEMVVWLQAHGSPALDGLARLLYVAGSVPVYLMLFAALYWSYDRKLARRVLAALIVCGLLIVGLKLGLARPRPFVAHPDLVRALTPDDTYGIPSGHVGLAIAVWGAAAVGRGRRWVWALLAVYAALIAWSRMYAGVHYPQDVAGGLVVGLISLWLGARYSEQAGARWGRLSAWRRAALALLASALTAALFQEDLFGITLAGLIAGCGVGFVAAERHADEALPEPVRQRVIRAALGFVVIAALLFGLWRVDIFDQPAWVQAAAIALVSFAATAGWAWVWGHVPSPRPDGDSKSSGRCDAL